MNLYALLLIAVALSLDACAVSVAEGIRRPSQRRVLFVALLFGLFQAVMPLVGYLLGYAMLAYIARFGHWVAAGLLCYIGVRMVFRSSKEKDAPASAGSLRTLILLAIATSIDALAAGIGLAITGGNVLLCTLVIGAVTFAVCLLGGLLGSRLGGIFQRRAEIVGGLILIFLGVKLLLEHLFH